MAFVGDSDFKTPMPDNVVYGGGCNRFIKSKRQPQLTESEIIDVCRKIQSGRLKPSIKTHAEHVWHVKTIVAQQQQAENACPKCGKPMVKNSKKRRQSG